MDINPTLRNFKCLHLFKKFAGAGNRTRACELEGRHLSDVLLRLSERQWYFCLIYTSYCYLGVFLGCAYLWQPQNLQFQNGSYVLGICMKL